MLARLDPANELNALRAAKANLAAAEAKLAGAQSFRAPGDAAGAGLDDARQLRSGRTGNADRPVAGRRRRGAAEGRHDQVSFTELKADAPAW